MNADEVVRGLIFNYDAVVTLGAQAVNAVSGPLIFASG